MHDRNIPFAPLGVGYNRHGNRGGPSSGIASQRAATETPHAESRLSTSDAAQLSPPQVNVTHPLHAYLQNSRSRAHLDYRAFLHGIG